MKKEVIVVGSGFAGSISAREFAEHDYKVLVLEKRGNIAGNMYDYYDENGILVHKYGPHTLYLEDDAIFEYLQKFSEFVPYTHTVNAEIDGKEVPLPFNLNSIDILFPKNKAENLKKILIETYGMEVKIPILELRKSKQKEILELADYIYEKVFVDYTVKMWGFSPDQIDPNITARIPLHISYDNRHFTQKIQVMPKHGYTKMFENMLNHKNITIKLNANALDVIDIKDNQITYHGKPYNGILVFTGQIEELFKLKYGELPYRSLYFEQTTFNVDRIQKSAVLNWPDKRPATRRTENKVISCQPNTPGITSTTTEYPGKYDRKDKKFNEPYYPLPEEECKKIYEKYAKDAANIKNLILVGRLAEYKYGNMENAIKNTFEKLNKFKF